MGCQTSYRWPCQGQRTSLKCSLEWHVWNCNEPSLSFVDLAASSSAKGEGGGERERREKWGEGGGERERGERNGGGGGGGGEIHDFLSCTGTVKYGNDR